MMYFFFFNDTATTEIYTLSLHDALPIFEAVRGRVLVERIHAVDRDAAPDHVEAAVRRPERRGGVRGVHQDLRLQRPRSEEHTSELQSRQYLVCRLLLEKKKQFIYHRLQYGDEIDDVFFFF